MQHVGQGFDMHEPVFDGHVEQSGEWEIRRGRRNRNRVVRQFFVESGAILSYVILTSSMEGHCRLIAGQAAVHGIDTESKEVIELGMKSFQAEQRAQKIPVEGFEVTDIKDDAMAFGDGALIDRIGIDDGKKLIGLLTGSSLIAQSVHDK